LGLLHLDVKDLEDLEDLFEDLEDREHPDLKERDRDLGIFVGLELGLLHNDLFAFRSWLIDLAIRDNWPMPSQKRVSIQDILLTFLVVVE
jgi:hypothetical protein